MSTPLFANSTAGIAGGDYSTMMQFVPFIAIFVIMYFLVLRPQTNKAKKQQEMISQLKKGDQVLTSAGIFGKIHKISDKPDIELEISEGVNIRILKSMIAETLSPNLALSSPTEKKQITSDVMPKKPAAKAKTARVLPKKEKDA